MSTKPWPRESTKNPFEAPPTRETKDWWRGAPSFEYVEPDPPKLCKHGRGSCEECGTTVRRDVQHTTEGGRGSVGKLRRGR
jgi:hypothetical protein